MVRRDHKQCATPLDCQEFRVRLCVLAETGQPASFGPFTFKTAALSPKTTKIVLLADQGTFMGFGSNVTRAMVRDFGEFPSEAWPGLIHHGGDISYAGIDSNIPELNVTSADEWEYIWDQYGDEMMPLTSHVPFMTTVGNHEGFYNWSAFTHRYTMPVANGGSGNFWFSYDFEGVHFASISTEHDYSVGCVVSRLAFGSEAQRMLMWCKPAK